MVLLFASTFCKRSGLIKAAGQTHTHPSVRHTLTDVVSPQTLFVVQTLQLYLIYINFLFSKRLYSIIISTKSLKKNVTT